ncbi:MAG TPA: XdhC family protein [Gemmatimonadaceae bacterium]|nr:XdhC family protein [Gemmatimonadaceae bacterium]
MPNAFGLIDPNDPELRDEQAVALATLVGGSGGGSGKKIGAKMIVGRSGRIIGGVTIGGCVDAQVVEAADALMTDGGAGQRLLSISLDDDEAFEIGLTCGGTLDVLLTRVIPSSESDPTVAAHRRALELLEAGEAAVIVTPLDAPAETQTLPASEIPDAGTDSRVFLDRVAPPLTLVIVGAGQIAMTLTRLARELDMRTVVVDGRDRYATAARFPDAGEIRVGMPSEIVAELAPGKNAAVVLVAHDYKYELPVLRQVLRSPVGYIGLLGSRKRGAAVRDLLAAEGFTANELARVHTPIGLDLGGKRPEEVALSILAEVVAVRNGKRP